MDNSISVVLTPRTLDYIPSALTAELRECDTFQFTVWDIYRWLADPL